MHRWLLILMIALLPLRGWVGEAMAGQMLAQQLVAIEKVATRAHRARAAGQFSSESAMPDCHGAAGAAAAAEPADGTCASCTQCQACSAVVLPVAARAAPEAAAHTLPGASRVSFASAPRAPVFKPPIA
jgi:hypothetical protein